MTNLANHALFEPMTPNIGSFALALGTQGGLMKKVPPNGASRTTTPAGTKFAKRAFPRVGLEDALIVPLKLKELNGGNPWTAKDLAKACGMSAKSSSFYYLTASSRDYGLTVGTRNASKITLTPLGKEIVYAPTPESELENKRKAFLGVAVFKKVLHYYKGTNLPEMKYLGNTLQKEFGLPPDSHEEFAKVFRINCEYLKIHEGPGSADNVEGQQVIKDSRTVVVVGEPKENSDLKAFVVMPFSEKLQMHPPGFFTEVLRSLITPAAIKAGFVVETANRQGSDIIQSTIVNDLLAADLIIADLTEHNPNVLFELGVSMAHHKPVALIKATGTGRIFDIDNMLRVFEYSANLWSTTVESDMPKLTEHIVTTWKNRESEFSYMKLLRREVDFSASSVKSSLPIHTPSMVALPLN